MPGVPLTKAFKQSKHRSVLVLQDIRESVHSQAAQQSHVTSVCAAHPLSQRL